MSNRLGTLYGVSLGPGDPGLITRRAWELMQNSKIFWTYPVRNKKSESYALNIALRAGCSLPSLHQALVFPMTHDAAILSKYWLSAAGSVLEQLENGMDVLFLVEGDASTYSTFGHLARTVKGLNDEVTIETIAGVPSFNAAAARLGTPLADVDDTVAIVPAGYGIQTIENLIPQFDTLVLIKVKPLLDSIIDLLREQNLLQHSLFIEKAGTPQERVCENPESLYGQKVNYLSLLLVRNPERVRGNLLRGCRKIVTDEPINSLDKVAENYD